MSKTFTITLLCVFASAFLTVLGAIFINTIALTDPLDDLAVPFTIVATLGIALTILGIIGWLLLVVLSTDLPDNKADCPHVMHSWHSKDAAKMKKDYQRALMYGAGPKFAAEITGYDPWEGVEEHPNQDDDWDQELQDYLNNQDDDWDQELQDYLNNHGQGDMTDDEHPNQDEIDFYNNSPPGSV